jgi:two-component system CheB/CheR fusion protein
MTNNNATDPEFERLLEFLRSSRGFDFTGYKRSSLVRRVNRRMQQVSIGDYADYLEHLEVHPEEFGHLFDTILINVTAFFRDHPAWDYLAQDIVPKIIETSNVSDGTIRVWSAGCASGEEAYTLAIVLAEALGTQEFIRRVRIYATDVDLDALEKGRHAVYTPRELRGVPEEYLERYFIHTNGSRVFRTDLRKSVIFGRHDLIQDAPISRLDLLVCRNTLMYFNAETQGRVMGRLHFALKNTGYLFLGRAEMLTSQARLFTPVSLDHRVFSRVQLRPGEERLFTVPQPVGEVAIAFRGRQARVQEAAFEAGLVPDLLVGNDGELLAANRGARDFLGISSAEVGHPLSSLNVYSHPVELEPLLERALSDGRAVLVENVGYQAPDNREVRLDVRITPAADAGGEIMGASITFRDMTHYYESQGELQSYREELEKANEELQSTNEELETTNEELQSTVEELETTNEELQSSNEELETTNEELQSANEEMETMNEELQATNEELQTMNDQLRQRSEELTDVNDYLDSILASVQVGMAVLDRDLVVRNWNAKARDLWGLSPDEAEGKSIVALDIGLPVDRLVEPINTCLRRGGETQQMVLSAVNRRGQSIQCWVSCSPMVTPQGEIRGAILLMEQRDDAGNVTG